MASQYTDRQRTRVFTRDTQNTANNKQKAIGQTQLMTIEKEGLFDGISLAQIIAGAAAAATSMVLASKIGIGGSVIGAAVSSVVTVVSSQLYRKFLTASAQSSRAVKMRWAMWRTACGSPRTMRTPRADTADTTIRRSTEMGSVPQAGNDAARALLPHRCRRKRLQSASMRNTR